MSKSALIQVRRIIKETDQSLKKNGYNPSVAKINLEAKEIENKLLEIELYNEWKKLDNQLSEMINGKTG